MTWSRDFETEPGAPGAVRQWLRELLPHIAGAVDADAILLLTSELVSNAVQYGRGTTLRVRVEEHEAGVVVGVTDENLTSPRLLHPPTDAPGGRGIALVDDLADRWGVLAADHGKQVWFEISRYRRE